MRDAGGLENVRVKAHELLGLKDRILEKLGALQASVASHAYDPAFTQIGLF
jgi:hypothetical protein